MQNHDITLISPCGIYCAECACYKVKDNPDLIAPLIANGIFVQRWSFEILLKNIGIRVNTLQI